MRVNIVWGRYFPFVSFVVLTAFDSTEKSDSSLHKCPSLRNCRKCSDGYFFFLDLSTTLARDAKPVFSFIT